MPGLLDGGGAAPFDLQQFSQVMSQAQSDPFSRNIPGQEYLGDPNQQQMPQLGMDQMPQQQQQQGMGDFAAPSLPTLPENFGGFGFGNLAPKQSGMSAGMRQQMISQLLPQLAGGGGYGY